MKADLCPISQILVFWKIFYDVDNEKKKTLRLFWYAFKTFKQ